MFFYLSLYLLLTLLSLHLLILYTLYFTIGDQLDGRIVLLAYMYTNITSCGVI